MEKPSSFDELLEEMADITVLGEKSIVLLENTIYSVEIHEWYTSMCQSTVSPFSLPASPQNIVRRLIMIFSVKVAISWCIYFGKIVYCNEITHSNWVCLKTGYPSTHCFIIIFPVIHGYFGGYTAFSHTHTTALFMGWISIVELNNPKIHIQNPTKSHYKKKHKIPFNPYFFMVKSLFLMVRPIHILANSHPSSVKTTEFWCNSSPQ